jgi:tetratricopeptide (TPR) repeat protein
VIPASRIARAARLAGLAVFACALLAYGTALAGDYVFDDLHSVSDNPALRDLGNLARFWWDPSAFSIGAGTMYRPALLTSFALNLAISPAAWSLKAGNVLLHATVAVLLFAWVWRLSRRLRASTVAALLFAAHPLASEAINLVSARSELLAALGMLVALHAHLSWHRAGDGARAGLGMVFGCVLACGSKETGAVLPAVAAAQALWARHARWQVRDWRRSLAGLLPLLLVVAAYLAARKLLLGQATVSLLGREGGDPLSGQGRSLTVQLATMGTLLPGTVLQMLLPWRLSFDPVVQFRDSLLAPAPLAGWGTMLALTAWALWPGPSARLRRLGTAIAWCTALPWIVVPLNMPLAEHRLYAPMLGVAAIAAAAAPRLWRLVAARAPAARRLLPVAAAALLVAAIAASAQRSWLYRDELALWRAELAHNPASFRSWWGVGTCLFRSGDAAGAIEPLEKAHALNARHFDTMRNYVEALASVPDAVAEPERSLAAADEFAAMSPRDPWARTLQVQAHLQAGRVRGGREHFEQAEQLALSCLQIATPKGYVYRLAAMARRGLGDLQGALAYLDTSIARGLHATDVRLDRAAVLRELGRARDAQRELLVAQREAPGDPAVMQALLQLAAPPR